MATVSCRPRRPGPGVPGRPGRRAGGPRPAHLALRPRDHGRTDGRDGRARPRRAVGGGDDRRADSRRARPTMLWSPTPCARPCGAHLPCGGPGRPKPAGTTWRAWRPPRSTAGSPMRPATSARARSSARPACCSTPWATWPAAAWSLCLCGDLERAGDRWSASARWCRLVHRRGGRGPGRSRLACGRPGTLRLLAALGPTSRVTGPADHFAVTPRHWTATFALSTWPAPAPDVHPRHDAAGSTGPIRRPAPTGEGAVQSATRLETYAICPRRYLFSPGSLGVKVTERPEDLAAHLSPSSADRSCTAGCSNGVSSPKRLERPGGKLPRRAREPGMDADRRRGVRRRGAPGPLRTAGAVGTSTGRPSGASCGTFLREPTPDYRAEHGSWCRWPPSSPFGKGAAPVRRRRTLAGAARSGFRGSRIDRIDRIDDTSGLFGARLLQDQASRAQGEDLGRRPRPSGGTSASSSPSTAWPPADRYQPTVVPVQVPRYWFRERQGCRACGRFRLVEGFELDDATVGAPVPRHPRGRRRPGSRRASSPPDRAEPLPGATRPELHLLRLRPPSVPPDRERSWDRKRPSTTRGSHAYRGPRRAVNDR